ncbi:MAG: DUF2891 domain-containing protein [Gammaproteobacteria bacterium]|nr:DUF2891 domain-containing protein [Gammaproteobacteria bacterium]
MPVAVPAQSFHQASAEHFAGLALECVHREYPNKIAHVLQSDADARPPRELTPAFYGCFDWHSSVHGHWQLVRFLRQFPDSALASRARAALAASLTSERLAAEARYLDGAGRRSFERPYGLAWLLQLSAELREWQDPDAQRWAKDIQPLEQRAAARLAEWLPKLSHPIRIGEHSQTAFAFGLVLDWARASGDQKMADLLSRRSLHFYAADRDCPLRYEPGGQDFLSPCIAEADLMRRVFTSAEFADWLGGFLPGIPGNGGGGWLPPAVVTDASDGKLAHLDGLNLSRAWMLEGIASALAESDPRRAAVLAAAADNARAGLTSVTGAHYAGGHWLGSFAMYLASQRGLPIR